MNKAFVDFLRFSTVSFHLKWNGTRLYSPESDCTCCFTSYPTTLGPKRISSESKCSFSGKENTPQKNIKVSLRNTLGI